MAEYIIVGNGTAAAGCIEGIRSVDAAGGITVVSEEKNPVYCRPLISYLLGGKTDENRMNYRPADFYEKNGCRVLYGRRAEKIDPEERTLQLDDGSVLKYDALCDAAGSSPFVPPFEGLETVEKRFGFMTLDDAKALKKAVKKGSRVLIVGAGLIGLKCAEGLRAVTENITVCDLADRVLSSILDAECASLMQKRLEENGISFMLSDSVASFKGNTAVMKSGKTVDFDVLVTAVGVRANTSLVRDASGEVNRGIAVNDRMETSIKGVYAAGDCAEGFDVSSGSRKVLALMPSAYMEGHAAGVNMAGGDERLANEIPMNSIGFFGLYAMTAGSYEGTLYEERPEGGIKRFYVKDGVLAGFMLIGQTERAGIYTSLVRERTPLRDVNFEILKKIATSAAFSSQIRGKKFGGVV